MIRLKPSYYNVWVPLRRGRGLLNNTASGALLLLEESDCEAVKRASVGLGALSEEQISSLVYGVASLVMWKKRNGAFFRLVKCTTNRPPWQAATGGTRHGQGYQGRRASA